MALAELAHGRDLTLKAKIFRCLSLVPSKTILAPRNSQLTEAACLVVASSLTLEEIKLEDSSVVAHWKTYVDQGLRHRNEAVQVAAASALGTLSSHVDCSHMLSR
jgi:hypothetical protein